MTPLDRVLDKLQGVKRNGAGWRALCPAHDDHDPSLGVTEGDDGKVLLTCYSRQCSAEAIAHAIGMSITDLFPPREQTNGHRQIVAEYDYTDEGDDLLFQVVRFEPKDFRQRAPDGSGGWVWKTVDVRKVLYRLSRVLDTAGEGGDVFVVEGERDVHAAEAAGVVATCNPGGAGKWRPEYAEPLRGARVFVVADRDDPGRSHARLVAASLEGIAALVTVCEPATGKDLADHLGAGLSLDQLETAPATVGEVREESTSSPRLIDGATFILDAPASPPAVWGRDDLILWAAGEACFLVGPPGVGKTTLCTQLVLGRIGLVDELLGFPIVPSAGKVLYLASDRPRQIARAFRRMVTEEDREILAERLVIWQGPPPQDFGKHPELLRTFAAEAGADTVFLDSLKDMAIGLNDDETAAGLNQSIQGALADGIDVFALHHQRKGQGGSKPKKLEDVYGNTWLVAGAGSVILLWGEAGDAEIDLVHLKQPAMPVGPLRVEHDHDRGRTSLVRGPADAWQLLRSRSNGVTAAELAVIDTEGTPTRNDIIKARRRLESLVKRGQAHRTDPENTGKGKQAGRYFLVDQFHEETF